MKKTGSHGSISKRKKPTTLIRSKKATAKKTYTNRRKGTQTNKDSHQSLLTGLVAIFLVFFFLLIFVRPQWPGHDTCDGCEPYGVCIPEGFSIHGIDISHHQGAINWELLSTTRTAEIPLSFIFIKATEGGDHKDNRFDENFAHAGEAGLIRGAYHFYNPATDPIRQADFFISNVTLEKGDLPPVIDIEVKPSRAQLPVFYAQLSTFLYRLEAHYGVTPIIYTSYKYKERYLNEALFDRYPLWIAHYHVSELKYQGKWVFWQHTDRAIIPGILEKTDLNVFHGSLHDLQKLAIN